MSRCRCRRGMTLVWTAVTLMVLIGIVGLSIDWAKIALNVHQMQNAADAAALAGAQIVKLHAADARSRAVAFAAANRAENLDVAVDPNPANNPNGEVVLGRWLRQTEVFVPTLVSPNAVRVRVNRPGQAMGAPALAMLFGPIFGVTTVDASRFATAMSQGTTGAGIICLAEDPSTLPGWSNQGTGLLLDGTAEIDLRGTDPVTGEPMLGDIQINGTATVSPWSALRAGGEIWAADIDVVGMTNPVPTDSKWEDIYANPLAPPSVNTGAATVEDPLADLPAPAFGPATIPLDSSGSPYTYTITDATVAAAGGELTLQPGYYPGGISVSKDASRIVLTGGPDAIYVFGGGTDGKSGLVMSGGTLVGHGVMIYISGDPTGAATGTVTKYGKVDVGGKGILDVQSRGDADYLPSLNGADGMAIWQDRDNHNYAKIIGTSDSIISGTLYFPENATEVGGNAQQMGNQLLAAALWVHGKISLGIAYDGRNAVETIQAVIVE